MFNETIDFIKSLYPNKAYIPLHEPYFDEQEKAYVVETIDSTFVSSVGKYVDEFEDSIKRYTGSKYAIATVNGTAALHMSLILAGVNRNDFVITQPLSFIATCNAISYIGAEPLFIDVDLDTLGLSPQKLEVFLDENCDIINGKCIHKKTKKVISACVPMHTFGHPVKIDDIIRVCNRFHIVVVEDAAESIGSFYKETHTGTKGLLGAFSFNGNKTITCGGGGVITTNNEELARLGKHLTTQAKIPHKWEFKHDYVGYNYRLPNLNAALACAQLKKLPMFIASKRKTAALYKEFFSNTNIKFIEEPTNSSSNYWLNAVLLNNRDERDMFLEITNQNGVMTRPAWTLMNKLAMFSNCINGDLSNASWIEDRLVNIPSSYRVNG
jgi:aminotransferase in exopolysaccharide biosynthesis